MTTQFGIEVERTDTYVRIVLSGTLFATGFTRLRETIREVLEKEPSPAACGLVLDLSEAGLFTSACLDVVYAEKSHADQCGWKLAVVAPQEDMQELFELTGFNRFFPIFKSLDEFVAELSNL